MFSANIKKGIILNGFQESLNEALYNSAFIKGRKENYTHERMFIKEVEKNH